MIRKSVVSSDDVGTPRRCRCQVARRPDCAIVKWQDAQTVPLSSHKMPDCVNVKWQDAQTVPMSSGKMPRLCQCQATRCPDSLSGNTPLRKWVQFPAQQYPADRRTHFFTSAATAKTREASDDVDVKVFLPEAELRLLQYPEPWSQGDPDAFQPFLRHVGQLDHPDVLRGKVLGVALSHRQTDRQTASKLVFYAQSTGAVISGRQKKR